MRASGKVRYEICDHLGNTRVSFTKNTNGTLQVVEAHDYYPHGGLLPGRQLNGSSGSPLAYQGQEYDEEVGLTAFNLRQYDSRLGRWLTPDPYGQHYSPYLAMSNNPVSFIDQDGGNDESVEEDPDAWDGGWTPATWGLLVTFGMQDMADMVADILVEEGWALNAWFGATNSQMTHQYGDELSHVSWSKAGEESFMVYDAAFSTTTYNYGTFDRDSWTKIGKGYGLARMNWDLREADAEDETHFSLAAISTISFGVAATTASGAVSVGESSLLGPIGLAVGTAISLRYAQRDLNSRVFATYTKTHKNGRTIYIGRTSGKNMSAIDAVRRRNRSQVFLKKIGFKDSVLDEQISPSIVRPISDAMSVISPAAGFAPGAIAYGAIRGREQDLYNFYRENPGPRLINAINPIWDHNLLKESFLFLSNALFGPITSDPRRTK